MTSRAASATLTLQTDVRFASAADRHAFAEELASEFARLAAKYHRERAPGGRRFRFFVGGYPDPGPEAEREPAEEEPDSGRSAASNIDRAAERGGERDG